MSTLAEALATTLITSRETIRTAIVESCPVPMFVADKSGDWVHINLNYQKLIMQPIDQVVGRGWLSTLTPSSRLKVESVWDHVVRHRIGVKHLAVEHVQPTGGILQGFMDVGYVSVDGFVGWFVPICTEPVSCPVHEHLLKNIVVKRMPAEVTFNSDGTNVSSDFRRDVAQE